MKLETHEMNINDLISAEYNPRKLSPEQAESLEDSLKRFGFLDPVIVNKHPERENIIVGGHQRCKVWKAMGNKTVPCVFVNLTRDQEKELNVRLNKNTGEFDYDLLREHFSMNELSEWGFMDSELDFFNIEKVPEETTGNNTVPESAPAKTVKGDVYELGVHRLMCGDATMLDDIERLLDGVKADLYITDPPYNVDYEGKTKDKLKIQNDKMDGDSFRQFLKDAFTNVDMHLKPGGVFYIWHASAEAYNFIGACEEILWKIRQHLIWKKQHMVISRQDYHWMHEPCLYGWKEGAGHLWASDRKQTTILEFDKPTANRLHPTMKPVELFEYQILNNTKGEDIVLDTFGGSGTTIIACEKSNRVARAMELDPKYCDIIVGRWVNFMVENNREDSIKLTRNGEEIDYREYIVEKTD